MDIRNQFLHAWQEAFPREEPPNFEEFSVTSHGGDESSQEVTISSLITNIEVRQKRIKNLELQLLKEKFVLDFLQNRLQSELSKDSEHPNKSIDTTVPEIDNYNPDNPVRNPSNEISHMQDEMKHKHVILANSDSDENRKPNQGLHSEPNHVEQFNSTPMKFTEGNIIHRQFGSSCKIRPVSTTQKKKPPVPLPRKTRASSFRETSFNESFTDEDLSFKTSSFMFPAGPKLDYMNKERLSHYPLDPVTSDHRDKSDGSEKDGLLDMQMSDKPVNTTSFAYTPEQSDSKKHIISFDNSNYATRHTGGQQNMDAYCGVSQSEVSEHKDIKYVYGDTLDSKNRLMLDTEPLPVREEVSMTNNIKMEQDRHENIMAGDVAKKHHVGVENYENVDLDFAPPPLPEKKFNLFNENSDNSQYQQDFSPPVPEKSAHVRSDSIGSVEDDGNSSDDEPIYYNIMELKRHILKRQNSTSSETSGSLSNNSLDVDDLNRSISPQPLTVHQRLSIAENEDSKQISHGAGYTADPDSVVLDLSDGKSAQQVGKLHRSSASSNSYEGGQIERRHSEYPSLHSPTAEGTQIRVGKAAGRANMHAYSVIEIPSSSSADLEKQRMRKWVVCGVLDSEREYVECLEVLVQYMKSMQAAASTSQPLISVEDINAIFCNLPEILKIHKEFVNNLEPKVRDWCPEQTVGDLFKEQALYLKVSGDYVNNYPTAITTLHKCCQENPKFDDLVKEIKWRQMKDVTRLEDLLFKPVNRLQRNTLVLHDLLKCTPSSHPDHMMLQKSLKLTQYFLENVEDPMHVGKDKVDSNRFLVKNSLVVEQVNSTRKLRHVFLFNDVIVCAKQKVSSRNRYNFDCKWYVPLTSLSLDFKMDTDEEKQKVEHSRRNVDSLKSKVKSLKGDLRKELKKSGFERDQSSWSFRGATRAAEKIRKKLAEQEAALVLLSPKLPFKIHHTKNKTYTFLMTSDYERDEWREAISTLKNKLGEKHHTSTELTSYDIQALLDSCKQLPKINNIGSALMRDGMEEDLLNGSLHITIHRLQGLDTLCNTFCCMEVDTFGHFYMKAKTNTCCSTADPVWNQEFEIDLEGSQTLRILCYKQKDAEDILLGKSALELSKDWLHRDFQEKTISMNEISLTVSIRYSNTHQTIKRTKSKLKSGVFGVRLQTVTKREKSSIPSIVMLCVAEIEKRGMEEVGIYRVSAATSDVQRLKKAFNRDSHTGAKLIADCDIHAVSGVLKLYLRELPEALFTDFHYPNFVDGLDLSDAEAKEKCMISLLFNLPEPNFSTIVYLLEHLVRVFRLEPKNKMSRHNLATVFGPTMLHPAVRETGLSPLELLSMETKDALQQSGILDYFLQLAEGGYDFQQKNVQQTHF